MIDRKGMAAAAALLIGGASQGGTKPPTPTPATPIGDATSWISADDYPASALRENQQGIVRIMLDVAADGHLTCSILTSSNVPALDEATCTLLTTRARFEPGHDTHGQPVATQWSRTIRWQLPDRSDPGPSLFHMMTCPGGDRTEIQVETAFGCFR